jgi:DNA-binding transcriptional ArsR family regulator
VQVFEALADPTRQRIVELLAARDLSAGDIAAHFEVSRPAVSRHLRVLREAGLTSVTRDAQQWVYRLDPQPLHDMETWLLNTRAHFDARLDALGAHLDRRAKERKQG